MPLFKRSRVTPTRPLPTITVTDTEGGDRPQTGEGVDLRKMSDAELGGGAGAQETAIEHVEKDAHRQPQPVPSLPVTRTLIDFALLASAVFSFEIVCRYIGPYERGFFCDDESIRLPYKGSTVSPGDLFIYVLCLPAITILCVELYRLLRPSTASEHYSLYEWGRDQLSSRLFIRLCVFYGYFLLALVSTHVMLSLAKFTVGRLRPHFIDVCQPNVNLTDCGTSPVYITAYECTSHQWDKIKEARLSFFSGHSALSICSATFTTLYLQTRLEGLLTSRVAVPLLQLAVMCSSMFIGYSRIFDHQHHWADVLIGFLLGIIAASFVAVYLAEFELTTMERKTINKGDHRPRALHYHHHCKQQRCAHHGSQSTTRTSYQSNGITHRAVGGNGSGSGINTNPSATTTTQFSVMVNETP